MTRFITTVEDADAAAPGTAIVQGYGEIYQRDEKGDWYGATGQRKPAIKEALFSGVPRPVVWEDGQFGFGYH